MKILKQISELIDINADRDFPEQLLLLVSAIISTMFFCLLENVAFIMSILMIPFILMSALAVVIMLFAMLKSR